MILESKLVYNPLVISETLVDSVIILFNRLKSGVIPFATLSFTVFKVSTTIFKLSLTLCNWLITSSNGLAGLNLFSFSNILISDCVISWIPFTFVIRLSTISGTLSEPEFIASIRACVCFNTSFEISFIIFISSFNVGANVLTASFESVKNSSTLILKLWAFFIVDWIKGISSCISFIKSSNFIAPS